MFLADLSNPIGSRVIPQDYFIIFIPLVDNCRRVCRSIAGKLDIISFINIFLVNNKSNIRRVLDIQFDTRRLRILDGRIFRATGKSFSMMIFTRLKCPLEKSIGSFSIRTDLSCVGNFFGRNSITLRIKPSQFRGRFSIHCLTCQDNLSAWCCLKEISFNDGWRIRRDIDCQLSISRSNSSHSFSSTHLTLILSLVFQADISYLQRVVSFFVMSSHCVARISNQVSGCSQTKGIPCPLKGPDLVYYSTGQKNCVAYDGSFVNRFDGKSLRRGESIWRSNHENREEDQVCH